MISFPPGQAESSGNPMLLASQKAFWTGPPNGLTRNWSDQQNFCSSQPPSWLWLKNKNNIMTPKILFLNNIIIIIKVGSSSCLDKSYCHFKQDLLGSALLFGSLMGSTCTCRCSRSFALLLGFHWCYSWSHSSSTFLFTQRSFRRLARVWLRFRCFHIPSGSLHI